MRRLPAIALSLALALLAMGRGVRAAEAAAKVSIVSDVTPKSGTMADRFVYTVEISIAGINGYDKFFPPRFAHFAVADVSQRQSTQWLYDPARGQEIKNVEVRRYVLVPRRAGKLKIEEAMVKVQGQEFPTKAIDVEVEDTGAPTLPNPTGPTSPPLPPVATTNPDLFIEAIPDKTKVVVGEQVTMTWKLFMASDELKQYRTTLEPQTEGFWVEELSQPTHFTYTDEQRGGRHYTTAVVLEKAVFPLRAGKLIIGPLGAELETFGGVAEQVRSGAVTLEVSPAPDAGKPAGFEPANVGQFSITASATPHSSQGGDPIQLTVVVEGQGNLRGLKIPALERLAQTLDGRFRVFAPKIDEKVKVDDKIVGGTRRYQFRLTPTKDGEQELPALELAFYDPGDDQYRVVTTRPISVSVSGAPPPAAVATSPDVDPGKNVISAPRLHGQVYRSSLSGRRSRHLHQQPLFWLMLAGPPFAYVALVAADRVRARLRKETPRARLRRAHGRARKALKLCELHIKGDRPTKFFGELSRALTDHLEDRLGTPAHGMTRDELSRLLGERGFPQELTDQLVRELENCDFARFAPSASGPGEMRAALRRGKGLLTAIERVQLSEDDEAA